jgi:hypothetical protein
LASGARPIASRKRPFAGVDHYCRGSKTGSARVAHALPRLARTERSPNIRKMERRPPKPSRANAFALPCGIVARVPRGATWRPRHQEV